MPGGSSYTNRTAAELEGLDALEAAFFGGSNPADNATIAVLKEFFRKQAIIIALTAPDGDAVAGTDIESFTMPYNFVCTGVRLECRTAPTGSTMEVDVNDDGASIFTTVLSIDAGETSSDDAATAAVIGSTVIAAGSLVTFDMDQVGSTVAGAGVKITLLGYWS